MELRFFFVTALGAAAVCLQATSASASDRVPTPAETVRVALVQFDAVPGQREHNLAEMERLTEQAIGEGADPLLRPPAGPPPARCR